MKKTEFSNNKSRNLKNSKVMKAASICCLLALSVPTALQAQNDSLPKLQKSALDYMLQRPHVTKHYENKKFGDHLFTDLGAGLNFVGAHDLKFGAQGGWTIGDFITPEHGVRLGVNAGLYRTNGENIKFGDVTLDYLMNITAVANRSYTTPHSFEVFGVAGIDVVYARNHGVSKKGLGAHLGLRGQYAFSPYTYIYAEPRLGVLHQNATLNNTWRKYRPTASIMAGLGYRMLTPEERAHKYGDSTSPKNNGFTDGLFVGVMGGMSFLSNAHPSTWKDNVGGRVALSVGKWFNAYNALRLTGTATAIKQKDSNKATAIGGQIDYMANLHNLFGGVDTSRRWWVNGVAGASINYASSNGTHNTTLGLGAGLQGNARIGHGFTFVVEPRVDIYNKDYITNSSTVGSYDCVPSLLLGFVYTNNTSEAVSERANDDFIAGKWHDHTFIEMGGGLNIDVTRTAVRHAFKYVRPTGYAAVGKWFAPLHGARVWGQLSKTRFSENNSWSRMDFGADYLFNFTNAMMGYRADRIFEFTGGLGMNISQRQRKSKTFFGLDASVRGTWHVSPFCAIFVEPKLQGYGKNYLPSRFGKYNIDIIASGLAGMQFNLRNYNAKLSQEALEDEGGLRSSFSMAGGAAVPANNARTKGAYNAVGRLSYTNWYTPLSAWRANLQGTLGKFKGNKYATTVVGGDYLTDLTAHAYGYDQDRVISVSALAGLNLGLDYAGGKDYFTSDVHVGGQLAVRVANNAHIFAEPQVGYHMSKRFKGSSRLAHWKPLMLLGVDYSFKRSSELKDIAAPKNSRYITINMGTGINSMNLAPEKKGYRWTYNAALGYGQWLTGLHGYEIDLTNMMVNRTKHTRYNVTAIRANYMMNLRTAVTGESTDNKLFQLSGLAGASLNFCSSKGRSAQIVPGFQAALQAGWKVAPVVEVYMQPEASFYSSKIIPGGTGHPVDGQLTLSVGSKFHF